MGCAMDDRRRMLTGLKSTIRQLASTGTLARCFSGTATGLPHWRAAYVTIGVCRLKWIAAAAIPLWILEGYLLNRILPDHFVPAARSLGGDETTATVLIYGSVFIGIATAIAFVFFAPLRLKIAQAEFWLAFTVFAAVSAEASQIGLSHFHPQHFVSFYLALMIGLALIPVRIALLTMVALASISVGALPALLTGYRMTAHDTAVLFYNGMAYAVLGIAVNVWQGRSFRARWLSDITLKRKNRLLEKQKTLLERQRNEAEQQRAEIARQGVQLMDALSSALTAPVARSYLQRSSIGAELRAVCVIACDAVNFSSTCEKLQPNRIVSELRYFFQEFDHACFRFGVEPLRAQGDSRIAISGFWLQEGETVHHAAINAVLAMLAFRSVLPNGGKGEENGMRQTLWPARIGINLGPVCGGVIDTTSPDERVSIPTFGHHEAGTTAPTAHSGSKGRLWFDVWGDTVNVAARLEQAAAPNQILVRESLLWETLGLFEHGPIGPVSVKSTHIPDATELYGIRPRYRDERGCPNAAFWALYNARNPTPVRPNPAGTRT